MQHKTEQTDITSFTPGLVINRFPGYRTLHDGTNFKKCLELNENEIQPMAILP